ncbi:MAG: 50S ribosomal protein L25/general stress protein Ctc [Gemmatimonadota bacterium]
MAATATISAKTREGRGKGAARTSRRAGRIPGVLYGHGEESVPLSVDANELQRLVHAISIENTIVDLDMGAGEPYKVLIRELQRHPFRDEFVHIDFFHVAMDEMIQVEIPIVLMGTPTGVKNKGGVMDHQLRELEVFCLPGSIPEKIELDVSNLDIGDSIHVSDIQLPDVEILTDLDRSVVAVLAPTVIEVEEAAAEEAILEPEVIGRGKEEEEEGEAGRPKRERDQEKE